MTEVEALMAIAKAISHLETILAIMGSGLLLIQAIKTLK